MASARDLPLSIMPLLVPEGRHPEIDDLALDLAAKCSGLGRQLHPAVRDRAAKLIAIANCYYSNLIEGHETPPLEIGRAVAHDYTAASGPSLMQTKALAHIIVQGMIDAGEGPDADPASIAYIQWVHTELTSRLPHEFRRGEPGALREQPVDDPTHAYPLPNELPGLLSQFEDTFAAPSPSRLRRLISVAAAHRHLLSLRPFSFANGPVARLVTHAMLLRLGVSTALWPLARGLQQHADRYRALLAQPATSSEAIIGFTAFFLRTSIEQIEFMESLLDPAALEQRIRVYLDGQSDLPACAFSILREALRSGSIDRNKAKTMTGYRDRAARAVLYRLMQPGLLEAHRPRGPLRLGFPIDLAAAWFPELLPL